MEYSLHVKDILPVPLCNLIEEVIYNDDQGWDIGTTVGGANENVRHVGQKVLTEDDVTTVSKRILYNELKMFTAKCEDIYREKVSPWYTSTDSNFSFLRYDGNVKGHYEYHTDYHRLQPRALTLLVGITPKEDYEGGDLFVGNKKEGVKLDKRECIMFPSNFMFPHKVSQLTKGKRKVLVIWTL